MDLKLTRGRVFAFLLVIWAGTFLPSLGVPELRGEEGRRVLPAVDMLRTGNWIVPQVGGEQYYNKPPGINWLIALSFKVTGAQTEVTARLVSVVFILGFISMLVWAPGMWLSLSGRLIAGIVFMTNISLVEKGRLIEIETVYICLTGMATLWWLDAFLRHRPGWALWTVPGVLLGYGMLVKGPVILLLFYVPVVVTTLYTRRHRALLCWGHLLGIGLIAGIVAAWWLPAYAQAGPEMLDTMMGQMEGRVAGHPDYAYWGRNIAMSFINFLPWLLFVPAMWDKRLLSHLSTEHAAAFKGTRWGLVIGFLAIDVMPNMMPRYSLPTFGLASLLLGWILSMHRELFVSDRLWRKLVLILFAGCGLLSLVGAGAWAMGIIGATKWLGAVLVIVLTVGAAAAVLIKHTWFDTVNKLAMATAVLVMLFVLQYAVFGVSFVKSEDIHRPVGAKIAELTRDDAVVYAYKPGFQTFFFYIREPYTYLTDPNPIDSDVTYLLTAKDKLIELKDSSRLGAAKMRELYEFMGRLDQPFVYLELDWGNKDSSAAPAQGEI